MRILSIDTTSMRGSTALVLDRRLVVEDRQGVPGSHSDRLLASIDCLFKASGWSVGDIEAIAVAIGPGSFTGLRIGLAAAKGIALAVGCKILGVSSLEGLALNGRDKGGVVVPLIDARRGEVYAAAYRLTGDALSESVMGECVLSPVDLAGRLRDIDGNLFLLGDGAIAYRDHLKGALRGRVEIADDPGSLSIAFNLAILAARKLEMGESDDLARLVPNYIRYSDAEIGFKGRG